MNTQTIPTQHQNVGTTLYDVKNGHLLEQLREALHCIRNGKYLTTDVRKPVVQMVLQKIEEIQNQK